jgi:hypothetical protein
MYLSYSGFKKHTGFDDNKGCPFAYCLQYIVKLEVPDAVDDRLGSIFGTTIGRIVERFYDQKAWKAEHPQALLINWTSEVLEEVIKDETTAKKFRPAGVLLWKDMPGATERAYANKEELASDLRDCVAKTLRIIRHERLLGPRADVEVRLDDVVNGHKLAGRADLIVERIRPHNDLVIVDGKGSKYRGDKVDRQQLLWYAMLFQRHEKILPDRVGFIYWRFDPPASSDWFDVTQAEVDALLHDVMTTISEIEKNTALLKNETSLPVVREVFKPAPDPKSCRYCLYAREDICPEGAVAAAKAKKSSKKKK